MERTKIFFTTIKPIEIGFNSSLSPMCEKTQYTKCKKVGECQLQLSGHEEDTIGGYGHYTLDKDKNPNQIKERVQAWRKEKFHKCKKVEFRIKSMGVIR